MTSPYISAHGWTGQPSAASLRLTARGRSLLMAAMALISCALLVGAAVSALAATASDALPISTELTQPAGIGLAAQGGAVAHTVVAGDTLWDLASALDPHADPRPLVDRIQQINGMTGSDLSVGSILWLPVPAFAEHARG